MASSLIKAIGERRDLATEYEATLSAIQQIQAVQKDSPEGLRQRLEATQLELEALLGGFPTADQASAELVNYYGYANELNTQLVRMEKMVGSPEEGAERAYNRDLFLLEIHGEIPDLMRFLTRVGGGPYVSFVLDNVAMGPDSPAVADADLIAYSSDYLGASLGEGGALTPTLQVTPTLETGGLAGSAHLVRLRDMMEDAIREENWPLVVATGRQLRKAGAETPQVTDALYQAHLAWGRQLAARGQVSEARAQYGVALALRPDSEEARNALADLAPMASVPILDMTASALPLVAVPEETALLSTLEPLRHGVTAGDSLLLLANHYHTTVRDIMLANGLRSTVIYVGQELIIPSPGPDR